MQREENIYNPQATMDTKKLGCGHCKRILKLYEEVFVYVGIVLWGNVVTYIQCGYHCFRKYQERLGIEFLNAMTSTCIIIISSSFVAKFHTMPTCKH